jgi:hypothetical protein
MPAKTKARDVVKGWPRGRSTESFWPHMRFLGRPFQTNAQYYRYNMFGETEKIVPEFRYRAEHALESAYRAGQNAMVDNYRAEYRRLTHADLQWLREGSHEPLKEAMKTNFYGQYMKALYTTGVIPVELALTIKACAASDESFWYRFRRLQVCTENG